VLQWRKSLPEFPSRLLKAVGKSDGDNYEEQKGGGRYRRPVENLARIAVGHIADTILY
jgi:hypothetical protein